MAADVTIATGGTEPAPLDYPIPGSIELVLKTLKASYDGTSAAGSFVPCVQLLTAGGVEVASFPLGQTLVAGASADVSWFPGVAESASSVAPITVLTAVNPVGGRVAVTSINPAVPTLIENSSSFTADGVSTYRVDFGAALQYVDGRSSGNEIALLVEPWRNGVTALGVISDINATTGNLTQSPCYLSFYDTPPAGTTYYAWNAYLQTSGGTDTGDCEIVAGHISTPHVTHPGYIAITNVGVL